VFAHFTTFITFIFLLPLYFVHAVNMQFIRIILTTVKLRTVSQMMRGKVTATESRAMLVCSICTRIRSVPNAVIKSNLCRKDVDLVC